MNNYDFITNNWIDITDNIVIKSLKAQELIGISPAVDKKDIAKIFISFGIVENKYDGRKVKFPVNSAGRIVYIKKYIRSFKTLFENSIKAWSEKEALFDGHKMHPNISGYHHYVNKLSTQDGEYYIRFTVRESLATKGISENELLNNVHGAVISDVSIYKNKSTDLAGNQTGRNSAPANAEKAFVDYKLAYYLAGVNK